jgi:hypothetical protein
MVRVLKPYARQQSQVSKIDVVPDTYNIIDNQEECKTCDDPMNSNCICKDKIKQQISGNKNVSFSKPKKKEELIPFGKLT